MLRYLMLSLSLCACYVPDDLAPVERVPEKGAKFVGAGDVPLDDEIVQLAVDEVASCLNVSCDPLGSGWSFWYALESDYKNGSFVCEGVVVCPLPDWCERAEDCPCLCQGLAQFYEMRVIVSPNLSALKHEIIHTCVGPSSIDHKGPEWLCE